MDNRAVGSAPASSGIHYDSEGQMGSCDWPHVAEGCQLMITAVEATPQGLFIPLDIWPSVKNMGDMHCNTCFNPLMIAYQTTSGTEPGRSSFFHDGPRLEHTWPQSLVCFISTQACPLLEGGLGHGSSVPVWDELCYALCLRYVWLPRDKLRRDTELK